MKFRLLHVAILACLILAVVGFAQAVTARPTVETVAEFRVLASKPLPLEVDVSLGGTVTFVNQKKRFVLSDATGQSAISDASSLANVELGDVIRLTGTTGFVETNKLGIIWKSIQKVGKAPLPDSVEADSRKMACGQLNYRRIHASGVIADVFKDEVDEFEHILLLRTGTETLVVALPDKDISEKALRSLIGAKVRIVGIGMPLGGIRQFLRPYFEISSLGDISILTPPPSDPNAVPELENFDQQAQEQISTLDQRRITGCALAAWNGNELLVRTGDGRLIRTTLAHGLRPPPVGHRVVVIGFPEADNFNVNLKGCTYTVLDDSGRDHLPCERVSGRLLMTGKTGKREINARFYGHLVQLTGVITALPSANDRSPRIGLDSDGFTIPIDVGSLSALLPNLSPGCQAEITGICVIRPSVWDSNMPIQRLSDLFLVPRSTQDVTILSRPPWLTVRRSLVVIGSLLALIVGIFIRNRMLNRLIQRRSRELLREEIAHAKAELKVEERTRLAVELHDTLSQNITGVALQIDAARTAAEKDPASVLPYLDATTRKMRNCRENLRNCLWDLRSRAFEETRLGDAIRLTIAPWAENARADIACDILCRNLSDNTIHAILCVIRELVINATRHGHATQIEISGHEDGKLLFFTVRDNGRGFDPATRPGMSEGHFGLQGIDERISRLGGTWQIDSSIGNGCTVTLNALCSNL